jgi:hypothetical protein
MNAQWIWSGDEAGYDDYREARPVYAGAVIDLDSKLKKSSE